MRPKLTPREARVLAGFKSMSEMASAMSMPESTYASKETGKTSFTIKEGMVFADLCNRSFADIDFLWKECPMRRDTQ